MTDVFSEWRRAGSTCMGGLVWQLQDLLPGAGWGIVDARGRPKSAWHALRQVWQPLQVLITDEGLNGLHVHVVNESATPRTVQLTFRCLRDGEIATVQATQTLTLAPRETRRLVAAELDRSLFRFHLRLSLRPARARRRPGHPARPGGQQRVAQPGGVPAGPPRRRVRAPGLSATVEQVDGVWWLTVSARRFARWVHIEDHAFRPELDWFHLGPGEARRIRLMNEEGEEVGETPFLQARSPP